MLCPLPPEYEGKYFFSDYCNGWIRLFDPETGTAGPFASGIATAIGLTVGEDGSLYYLAHHGGEVYRVIYTQSQAPSITVRPEDLKVAAGEGAAFSVQASGAAPLAYRLEARRAAPGIGADAWSARWTGEIEAQASGPHTFFLRSNDGARLWIDGVLVVDDWKDHASRMSQGTLDLQQGRRYSIRLDYHDTAGRANLRLLWSAPGLPRQVVPAGRLFP